MKWIKIKYYQALLIRNRISYWLEDNIWDSILKLSIRLDELYWRAFFRLLDSIGGKIWK